MRDGESFAIAGLLQDDFRDLNGQVPWLGDIPVLGALFRSAEYQRAQTELVIIVTPHLVTPTGARRWRCRPTGSASRPRASCSCSARLPASARPVPPAKSPGRTSAAPTAM